MNPMEEATGAKRAAVALRSDGAGRHSPRQLVGGPKCGRWRLGCLHKEARAALPSSCMQLREVRPLPRGSVTTGLTAEHCVAP